MDDAERRLGGETAETVGATPDSAEVPPPTIAVLSLGCRANQEEVDCLLGSLTDRGFRPVPFGQPADWTLVNTCSVTAAGESDARQAIRRAARLSGGRVVATGLSLIHI
ncbi:MAG: hypothetical protein QUU85_07035 [Candidatus Eisenbacteria bacterium]|nr:hypothetical protein [Candidatus Eisenbacteria bacterium]